MIYHITIIENTPARLIREEITIRDEIAKDLLVRHFTDRGYIVTVKTEI